MLLRRITYSLIALVCSALAVGLAVQGAHAAAHNPQGVGAYDNTADATRTIGGDTSFLGYQQITALSSSTALTVPTGARMAVIVPEAQDVRFRHDGTAPTAGVGMPITAGGTLVFRGDLSTLRFIEQNPSATLNVDYYQ